MKKYKIISFVYAKNLLDAAKNTKKAEVVDVELQDDIEQPRGMNNKLGF